ncbi:MAG: Hsp20/alpha crystallin family protein [Deltaproteobacteria bacterium]|nr:Hsp20/alpha crystallin family protein [Deltaproteobacteria bacterium]
MNLIRYNPSNLFDATLDRMLHDFWGHGSGEQTPANQFNPRVDISDEKDTVVLRAELPGVDKNEVDIKVENGVLTISGEKKQETQTQESGFYRCERSYGRFERSFRLPDMVAPEKIEADYRNGLLTVTLPKRPEASPRQIAIKEGNGKASEIKVK